MAAAAGAGAASTLSGAHIITEEKKLASEKVEVCSQNSNKN